MKLEAGKYYRTRNERKAYVAAVLSPFKHLDPDFMAIGWIEGSDRALARTWNPNTGAFITDDSCQADLIAEWKEPKKLTAFVNFDADGCTHTYDTRESADENRCYDRIACVEVNALEGDGLNK